MKLKKDLLSSMPMPKKGKDPMLELDESVEELDAPSAEGEAEPGMGEETAAEEMAELAEMPEEDLIAELEKRGFKVEKMEEELAEGEAEEEMV
jgi:hypothetical protein